MRNKDTCFEVRDTKPFTGLSAKIVEGSAMSSSALATPRMWTINLSFESWLSLYSRLQLGASMKFCRQNTVGNTLERERAELQQGHT